MTKRRKKYIIKKMIKFVESKEFTDAGEFDCPGLCEVIALLWMFDGKITVEDKNYISKLIQSHKRYVDGNFIWKPYNKKPRINWLNKKLQLLENN